MEYTDFISGNAGELIAHGCDVSVEKLKKKTWHEIVDELILPLWVGISGQCSRHRFINDGFMRFMAGYGQQCFYYDFYRGEILFEIAMERILNGAVPQQNPYFRYYQKLPLAYQLYSAEYDTPVPMSGACFDFLRYNLAFLLRHDDTRKHAAEIIFGILDNLTPNGHLLPGFDYGRNADLPCTHDLWLWAANLVCPDVVTMEIAKSEMLDKCLTYNLIDDADCRPVPKQIAADHFSRCDLWRRYLWYWHARWPEMWPDEQDRFFRILGVSGMWDKRKVRKAIKHYDPIWND